MWSSGFWHTCKLPLRMLCLRGFGDFMEISGADFDGLPCAAECLKFFLRPCLFIIYIYLYYICWTTRYWNLPHASHLLLFCCFNIGPWQKVFNFLVLSDHGHPHVKEGSLCLTFELNLEVYLLSAAYWNLCCYIDSILACPWVQYGDWWIFHGWCILPINFEKLLSLVGKSGRDSQFADSKGRLPDWKPMLCAQDSNSRRGDNKRIVVN